MENDARRTRSPAWYILPILLGIVGGIVAYFALRHDDPGKGKTCLYVGIGLTAVSVALGFLVDVPFDF